MLLETTALGRLLAALSELPDRDLNQVLNVNAMGISDVTPYDTIEDAAQGMLTGMPSFFVDGYGHALKIADKGYPGMGVQGTGFGKGDPWFEGGVYRFHQNEYGTYP